MQYCRCCRCCPTIFPNSSPGAAFEGAADIIRGQERAPHRLIASIRECVCAIVGNDAELSLQGSIDVRCKQCMLDRQMLDYYIVLT